MELKAIACGQSGVILQLEPQEGKAMMRTKEYSADYNAGTAILLRLTKPFAGTGRFVVADSAFSSVQTLKALIILFGLWFMGMVKTAHALFPKKFFEDWFSDNERKIGDSIVLGSTYSNTNTGLQKSH